ncbi:MAG: hypothetical protein WB867_03410 [Candidatus Dormiibacterota bacterium]
MPQLMDYHAGLKLSQESIDSISGEGRAGTADQFGARQVDLYQNPEGNLTAFWMHPMPGPSAITMLLWASTAEKSMR